MPCTTIVPFKICFTKAKKKESYCLETNKVLRSKLHMFIVFPKSFTVALLDTAPFNVFSKIYIYIYVLNMLYCISADASE